MGVPMKLHAAGEDYLEAILVLQKNKEWCVPWMLLGTWRFQSSACVTQ